jgi:HEAT repeat protein
VGVTLLMAGSFLFFRLLAYTSGTGYFLYGMLAWFHALYLLNNLQFWGIATIIFDLRQSKRLFGLISSGDIPAKFVGYSMAYYIIPYVGEMNLLYFGAGCLLASIPFMLKIIRTGKLQIAHHGHDAHHSDHNHAHQIVHHGVHKIAALLKNFLSNTFIRDIAFISMLAFICIIIVDYGFYAEVKTVKDDSNLASFIAAFMAILRISALLAKMIFTGRLTNSLGIKQTLLITPILLTLLIGLLIVAQWVTDEQKVLFYLFGATAIIIDVCRTVFNSPVLLTLMQPLPTHERLRAHNIVKGIMDPFAFLIAGVMLLILAKVQGQASVLTISYLILGVSMLWIPGIFQVNKQYLKILVQTISSRYFTQEEFSLKDEAILQAIRKKIASGNDLEVISILKMLHSKKDPVAEDLVGQLLDHSSEQVVLETLRLIAGQQPASIRARLSKLLETTTNAEIRHEVVKALTKTSLLAAEVEPMLQHQDQGIRKAALSGMLFNPDTYIRDLARDQISALINSVNRVDRLLAAFILQDVKDHYEHPSLHLLILDQDPQVQSLAIKCIGKASGSHSLHALMQILPQHPRPAMLALETAGDDAVEEIRHALVSDRFKGWDEKFIQTLGRVGGKKAQKTLVELLDTDPARVAPVIKALYRTRYKADTDETLKKMETLARLYLVYGVELLHMKKLLQDEQKHAIMERAIDLEIQEIRDLLLSLFACMFDRVKMNQARKGLDSHSNENIANAMELIELTVKRDIGRHFNHMFETTSVEHRCSALRALLKDVSFSQVEHIVTMVLNEKPVHYQAWTKACALYMTRKYLLAIDPALIRKFAADDNRMVKETAQYALANSYI